MGVAARPGGDTVGIEDWDDPEVELPRRGALHEPVGDRGPCGLVAVNAADDEEAARRVEVADLNSHDGTAVDRSTEEHLSTAERVARRGSAGGGIGDEHGKR
jgi:hypothetical protein